MSVQINKPFTDVSTMQGVVETFDASGTYYRFTSRSPGTWDVYKRESTPSGTAWVRIGGIAVPRHYCRPRALYKAAEEAGVI